MQETENDILKRVRKIEIKTRGLSNEIFAGKYHTAFRGRGMSFSEVREYRAGDDVRDIDWNVTARSRKPHIKVYEEERELTMMLLVDVSASRMFGSTDRLKKNIITEIAAVLAFSAAQNNDKVGCIFFSDRVEKFILAHRNQSADFALHHTHVFAGYTVPPYYDSLIAKLVAHGHTREQAIARMSIALSEFAVEGIKTNIRLHRDIMADEKVRQGGVSIHYLEEKLKTLRS